MPGVPKIQSKFFFAKPWMVVCYFILCCGLICLAAIPHYNEWIIIATLSIFALLLLTLCIHDISFGFYAMIIFGFLLAFIDRMTDSNLPLYSAIFLAPFGLFIFLIIRSVFYHTQFKLERHPLIYGYFIIFAYSLVQIFNPEMGSLLGWIVFFRQLLSNTALLLISLYLFRDLKSIRFFFRFLLGAIFIAALYGCYQQWVGLTTFELRWVYTSRWVFGLLSLPGGGIRKFSFFTDPANFGTLMAAGGVGTLILAIESSRKRTKIIWGLFTLIIILGMSYSGTRTANIMIASGLLLYIMMTLYQKRTRMLALGVGTVFLFIMNVPIYGNVTINRFRSAFRDPTQDASYDVRLENRQIMRPYLYQHPFGGGIGTTGESGKKYNPNHFLAPIAPDSSLVANFMETGWIGLVIHLAFLFLLLVYAIHYYYHCQIKEIKTYYAIIAVMLFSLGLVGAYAQYTLVNVPQIFVYIPFIALTIKLHTFDYPNNPK